MVTLITQHMIAPGELSARMASDLVGKIEVGDFCWSARAAKSKWLLCQGQAVSRTTYAALFTEIGVSHGVGDGSTTFNVPEGKGRALIGAGYGGTTESFLAAAVTTATDLITVASNVDRWLTGMRVVASSTGTLPAPLVGATDYYVIRMSATTIKLASSLANALAGTAIDITTAGTGTHMLLYPLSVRAVGENGGEETHANVVAEMPAHAHNQIATGSGVSGTTGNPVQSSSTIGTNAAGATSSTGGNGAHNNMQPYLVENLFIYAGV